MLKNKLGLRDQVDLSDFEALSVAIRAEEPLPVGRFSPTHYCIVHRHLFQDVYRWAGRYRTVRLTKDRSPFCFPEHIAREMRVMFGRLHGDNLLRGRAVEDFAEEAAKFLAYLNAIHPFREGNGRTQLTFTALLSAKAGHSLKLARLDSPRFLKAMIDSFFGDEAPLRRQLRDLLLD